MSGAWTSEGRVLLVAVLAHSKTRDVAARCHVSAPTISLLASGAHRDPSLRLANALFAAFGIPTLAWEKESKRVMSNVTPVNAGRCTMAKQAVTEIADNRLNRAAE